MNYKGIKVKALISCYECRELISNSKNEREVTYPDGYLYSVCVKCANSLTKQGKLNMKKKQLLITVYFDSNNSNLVLDQNTDEDYDYEKCITKVITDHLKSVNSDVTIVDVALDTDTKRIIELVTKENK
jgi:hypothetical protein